MQNERFLFMPCFSIEPNKVSTFNKVFYRDSVNQELKTHHDFNLKKNRVPESINAKNRVEKKFHGFELSDNAYRTLKRKINWLFYLAKPKSVTTYNGRQIYNFKCAFLTFTLPNVQKESTKEVTNKYFNQLLTEIRTRTGMQNYVWRLEFQKNGNVHYHLVTDTYIDYYDALNIWNRILGKGTYIDEFQAKFKPLKLSEYCKMTDPGNKLHFSLKAKRYANGKKNNWRKPPTVDVKSVISNAAISSYISKYFAKDSSDNPIKNKLDNAENSKALRLWYCSRSLSKLKTVCDFCEAVDFSARAIVENVKHVRKVVFKYATVFYFDIAKLPAFCKKEIALILKRYAKDQFYEPAT